jgi:hypothetical protein
MSPYKKVFFYAVMIVFVVAITELVASAALYYRYRNRVPELAGRDLSLSSLVVVRKAMNALFPALGLERQPVAKLSRQPETFFTGDPEQGYRANPGPYVFRYARQTDKGPEHLDTYVTINSDGSRATGPTSGAGSNAALYVFGDSCIFGDGVSDEQTFSFLLQAAFPSMPMHLYALGGYSWVNALISVERMADRIRPEDIVILGYADFYKERQVAAPSRLRAIEEWTREKFPGVKLDPKDRVARARLAGEGKLVLDTVPMYCQYNQAYCDGPEPSGAYQDAVARALLQAIAKRLTGKIYLLHFFGEGPDPVLQDLPPNVELVSATSRESIPRDDVMGFDNHPGPYWHYAIYRKLRQVLERDLKMRGNDKR